MPRFVIVLAVPGVVAGLTLLDGCNGPGQGHEAEPEVRLIEIGLSFDGGAVRAALPEGLEPAEGLTGGLAVYFITDGRTVAPQSAGYVWLDVKHGPGARYMLRSFLSEVGVGAPGERSERLPADLAAEAGGATRYAVSVTSGPERLDLVVDPVPGACSPQLVALSHYLFASGMDGDLEVPPGPFGATWCEAHVAAAGATAPVGDVLGPFAPERVLWAGVAIPLGSAMPEVPS
jgi:hypothetical protein